MRNTLTAVKVAKAGPGILSDGGGLLLTRTETGGRWTFRFTIGGKRRDMGLGSYPTVSLAEARKLRDRWAEVLRTGRDPIEERKREPEADPTFAELVASVFDARRATLKGDGERGRWLSPLTLHVLPKIGKRRVSTLTAADIRDTLRPIWRDKHETASKALRRTAIVLKSGKRQGLPCDPFVTEAAREMLGAVVAVETPHAALPWQDVPALYAKLSDTASGQCLRLSILTAVRSMSARGARFDEFEGDVWTVPADRMKGGQPFRVPLSAEALRIVERQRLLGSPFLFPGTRGTPITSQAVDKALRAAGVAETAHGFRTSFRTWAQVHLVPYDVAEACLAHVVGSSVVRAYARDDLLEARREVMGRWAGFVMGKGADE